MDRNASGSNGCAQVSQFDPIELLDSRIPFMDPFTYDDKKFQASCHTTNRFFFVDPFTYDDRKFQGSGPTPSRFSFVDPCTSDDTEFQASGHTTSLSFQAQKACQLQTQGSQRITDSMLECMPLQHTPSPPTAGPVYADKDLQPKVRRVRRARLSPEKAIRIFMLRRTKTKDTAALLAAKYGITPKAIRDIWTRKSWVKDTRPYWTHLDVS